MDKIRIPGAGAANTAGSKILLPVYCIFDLIPVHRNSTSASSAWQKNTMKQTNQIVPVKGGGLCN